MRPGVVGLESNLWQRLSGFKFVVLLQQPAQRDENLPDVGTNVVVSWLILTFTFRDQAEQPAQAWRLIGGSRWGRRFQANEAVGVQPDLHALIHPHASRGEELHSEQTKAARRREAVNRNEHCARFKGGIFVEPLVPAGKTPC
jgi:hypothetical protein